jgi:transposase InsO family protein
MNSIDSDFDALWGYCTSNERVVPMPQRWSQIYGLLKNTRQKASGDCEPRLPLILAAWRHSTPIEKRLRFKEHLEWPKQHGADEGFNGRLCDECLNQEWFQSRQEARVLIENWRRHYNEVRPHSSLRYMTPVEFHRQHATSTNPGPLSNNSWH